jgi:hypothetical protein
MSDPHKFKPSVDIKLTFNEDDQPGLYDRITQLMSEGKLEEIKDILKNVTDKKTSAD